MTDHTIYLIACLPLDISQDAHEAIDDEPAGTRFWSYDEPTHTDDDGDEWVVFRSWSEPVREQQAAQVADHFPDAEYSVTRERVERPADGDTVSDRPDHGAFVVFERDDPPDVLEGLERIEVEGEEGLEDGD